MEITLRDKSNYFKGLLVLITKDKVITEEEQRIVRYIGKILDYEKEYCETALKNMTENKYILESPPLFSSEEMAKVFIKDGIKIGFADKNLHLYELNWLKLVAEANSLKGKYCLQELEQFFDRDEDEKVEDSLEIKNYL